MNEQKEIKLRKQFSIFLKQILPDINDNSKAEAVDILVKIVLECEK